ncbi:MAG: guanylate kinase [Pseudobdellovibrionaceae bacterium]
MKTQMIILAAPSGAGKSSFVDKITKEDPRLRDTITYTTREMRQGEFQGHPYYFVSKEEFEKKITENFFIEWARVHTNLYGTPHYQIEEAFKEGKCVIMDVDVQGSETFKSKFPEAVSIFILPPSIQELKRRISLRDGKMPPDIEVRMSNAEKEIALASKFDYQIVNDEFSESYDKFKKIVEKLLA